MLSLENIFLFVMILARISGLFLYVPFLAHKSIPVIAKVALASAFALMIFPLVQFDSVYPDSVFKIILWLTKELIVGLTMGFAVRMIFFVLDYASYVLTIEIGLRPSPEFDPSNAQASANPLGSVIYFLGLMVLLSGSEYNILRAFVASYQVAPLGFTEVNALAIDFIVRTTAGVFKIGLLMAAPIIAVNFLVNLVFAALGKVVPKLNVFILSFSIRIMAGTTVLAFSAFLIVHYISNYIEGAPGSMLRFILFRPIF